MKRNGIYFKNEWLVSKYYKQSDSSDRASNPGLTWKRNWVSSDHNRKKKKKEKRTKVMHWEVVWFQSTPSNPHISKHSRRSPACLWHCASPSRTAAFWCLVSNGGLLKSSLGVIYPEKSLLSFPSCWLCSFQHAWSLLSGIWLMEDTCALWWSALPRKMHITWRQCNEHIWPVDDGLQHPTEMARPLLLKPFLLNTFLLLESWKNLCKMGSILV